MKPSPSYAAGALELAGYLRFGGPRLRSAPPEREWLHFVVASDACDVLMNFSLTEASDRSYLGRTLLLVRTRAADRAAWEGDVDTHVVASGDVGVGRIRLHMGDNHVTYHEGFRVSMRCRRRDVSVVLALEPISNPCLVQNVGIGGASVLHWLVAPHLRASGVVRVHGREYQLSDAPAYHDHNWGNFHGGELAWEWGCALAREREGCSAVFARVIDQRRDATVARGLLLWRGAERAREFRGSGVQFERDAWLRPPRTVVVPRALASLPRVAATDVPARFTVRAQAGEDVCAARFESHDVARVVAPHDSDLQTTIVHEVVGRATVEGRLGGVAWHTEGPAFWEVLRSER